MDGNSFVNGWATDDEAERLFYNDDNDNDNDTKTDKMESAKNPRESHLSQKNTTKDNLFPESQLGCLDAKV